MLLVTGNDLTRSASLQAGLTGAGLAVETFQIAGEPTTESILEGAAKARQTGCDAVIGMGVHSRLLCVNVTGVFAEG